MNALELRGVCKHYRDFTLDHLNLTLPCGTIMGLIGENGAGKSTTIKLILGMIRRDEGTITVMGRDNLTELTDLKEDIGVVLDEVGLSGCLTPRMVGQVMAGVYRNWQADVYDDFLRRLSLPENKPFKDFSRGMKMKLGIAVAMSHQPKLLILDEATSGLDPLVRDEILDVFSEFTRDESHAVLISSHIVSDLEKICDYIAFMHKGKLLLCEEKDRLCERYGIVHCSREQAAQLPREAILGHKEQPYDVALLMERRAIPAGWTVGSVDIEQLFILMAKEER